MKKLLCILTATMCLFFSSCGLFGAKQTLIEKAEEALSISLDEGTIIEKLDTHGARGEGESFLKVACPDGFEGKLGFSWKALPLQGEAYRYFYEWGGVFEHPDSGEKIIPEVENGYWYFKSTGTMNWEFALFDCEENILYFYVWDA